MKMLFPALLTLFCALTGQGALASEPSKDEILVQGAAVSLTRDNAEAFLEALSFSLEQAGAEQALDEVSEEQMIGALRQYFTQGSLEEQMILSQSRAIWSETQANWPQLSLTQKRDFVYSVIVMGLGEQTALQLLGSHQRGGRAGSGEQSGIVMPDIDSGYAGQDCWASAGCTGYDAGSDTYSYESYDSSSGSYDTY